MSIAPPTSLCDAERALRQEFRAAGIDTPELDARLLMQAALGCDRAHLIAHAADALFEYSLLPDFPRAFRTLTRKAGGDARRFVEAFHREERKSGDDFLTMNIVAMSACYSPDDRNPPAFDLPFDMETGELRQDVWARWLAHDPVRMIEQNADYRDALRTALLVFLDAGTRDEHALDLGARAFARRLRAHGIPTTVRDTRGSDIDGACGQLAAATS